MKYSQCTSSLSIRSSQPTKPDESIVLIIGAGIHASARMSGVRGREITKSLASWSELLHGTYQGSVYGHSLAWELNALSNHDIDDQAAKRIKKDKKELATRLKNLAKKALSNNWQPPLALENLLTSGKVTDVISLNVDLVLETWLVNNLHTKTSNQKPSDKAVPEPEVTVTTKEPNLKRGEHNKNRQRQFTITIKNESHTIRFWYPHGDSQSFNSLQFSLDDYAASLGWMDRARRDFKGNEKKANYIDKNICFKTWLDPFLTKKTMLILGASLDKAEWDIWRAMLYRFRNFARHEHKDWYPITKILTCKDHHSHVPDSYIEKIEGCYYEEAWGKLLNDYCGDS